MFVDSVVEFATYSDMKTAIDKLDDTELGGKRIRIEEDSKNSRRRRFVSDYMFKLLRIRKDGIPEYKQREKFNDAYSAYAWKNKL